MNIQYKGFSHDEYVIKKLKSDKLPVVIGGNGSLALAVERKLRASGLDNVIKSSIKIENGGIRIVDEVKERFNFILGYLDLYGSDISPDQFIGQCEGVFYVSELFESEKINYDYYKSKEEEFAEVYRNLQDDKSRLCMEAFLNSKINEDSGGLWKLVEVPQYFSAEFLKVSCSEALVDCGAFQGDSIEDFLKWTGGDYSSIVAFEPDKNNIAGLKAFVVNKTLDFVKVVEAGAYDFQGELKFHRTESDEMMSRVQKDGEISIKVDTIDNVCKGMHPTFIKMDVEGSEKKALTGARQTIMDNHPVLAISAYHKKDDLFVLMKLIKELWGGYKFYFRLHKALAIDAVLYAIPY